MKNSRRDPLCSLKKVVKDGTKLKADKLTNAKAETKSANPFPSPEVEVLALSGDSLMMKMRPQAKREKERKGIINKDNKDNYELASFFPPNCEATYNTAPST